VGSKTKDFPVLQNVYTGSVTQKKLLFKSKKVARWGSYSTAALCIAECALAPNVLPSSISRGTTTPSGAGTLYERRKDLSKEFSSQIVIHCKCEVLLHAAKLGHGRDYLTSPP
jgi:hypothetical protein